MCPLTECNLSFIDETFHTRLRPGDEAQRVIQKSDLPGLTDAMAPCAVLRVVTIIDIAPITVIDNRPLSWSSI